MHCLYGLQQLGLTFELKGGTSLSKGFQIINRFSEDIDIRIEPPIGPGREDRPQSGQSCTSKKPQGLLRLAGGNDPISTESKRLNAIPPSTTKTLSAAAFDCHTSRIVKAMDGLKSGRPCWKPALTTWRRTSKRTSVHGYMTTPLTRCEIIDNRAKGVPCYDPAYTFVEKLQTVSTKFRQQRASKDFPI